jgi:hypothetical protein
MCLFALTYAGSFFAPFLLRFRASRTLFNNPFLLRTVLFRSLDAGQMVVNRFLGIIRVKNIISIQDLTMAKVPALI